MKLYKEILIESAEQAEALPPSTPIIIGPFVAMRPAAADAWGMAYTEGEYSSAELVSSFPDYDIQALVPIEAKEEHKGIPLFPRPADAPWPPRSTPNQDVDGRWYYIDEDGRSIGYLGDQPFHDLMVAWIDSLPRITRYTTPWEPQQ